MIVFRVTVFNMTTEKIDFGKEGEDLAINYLKKKGYKILERNFRCRMGEIDIIALHKGTTVFIEVKTRSDYSFGIPEDSINKRKQRHMIMSALSYIKYKNLPQDGKLRFDVIGIDYGKGKPVINLIQDAFQV